MKPEQCRAARALLGISREYLANMAGLSRNTIQHFEGGLFDPLTETVMKLRAAFVTMSIQFLDDGEGVGVKRGPTLDEVVSLPAYAETVPGASRPAAPEIHVALDLATMTIEQARAARAMLGLSQAQAAQLAGLGQSSLVAYETGRRILRAGNIRKLKETYELLGIRFVSIDGRPAIQATRDRSEQVFEESQIRAWRGLPATTPNYA